MKQNRLRALVRTLGVLALAVFGAATASAQFGKIDGRVKNAAGAPISPAATVSLVGQTFTTTTNKDGYYFFLNVPSGIYTISVTAIGFRVPNFGKSASSPTKPIRVTSRWNRRAL